MTKHFKTDSVIVRKFNMKDVEQVYSNILFQNDSENTQEKITEGTNLESVKHESIEQTKLIVKSAINEYYTDEPTWAVEDKVNKNLVGVIRVTNYSKKNKMCNITWTMSYKYWDNKFMEEALKQIFKFMFTKKNIELIECSYYEQDSNTSTVLDEIGMTKEATLRDRRFNESTNKKENFVIYSISKDEFFSLMNLSATKKTSKIEEAYRELKIKI